ncbi:MAG: serine/threonine-protein kinase [Pirellula sp.]
MDSIFRKAATASGLIESAQWEYCMRLLRFRCSTEPQPVSNQKQDELLRAILIEQGAITEYQAEQMCNGRYKFKLGPYIITDFIAQGGMGQVFKAIHHVMGRDCAVKVVPLGKATPESIAGFNREIRLQAKLDCPYLVRAYDAGQDGVVHFLVTEFVPGMDLRRLIKAQGPLPQEQAARIVMQAALGLEYAHKQGMVHRDVKPGNILVTPDGIAKVSDVGLAGFTANLMDDPRAGKIVGTADYLSPEQIRTPLQVGPVSDIYSLGCTLYYAVCGKVPFPGGDTAQKVRRHLEETPFHPRRFAIELSEEFVEIIAEMMDKNPINRMQSCAEVAARLEPWAMQSPELHQPKMSRGPWSAPPPPALEPEAPPISDDVVQETSAQSGDSHQPHSGLPNSQDLFGNSQANGPSSDSVQTIINDPDKMNTQSPSMAVALTIAILLPPALLIGAIIGYLVARMGS